MDFTSTGDTRAAYRHGWDAARKNDFPRNPYDPVEYPDHYDAWECGYDASVEAWRDEADAS